MNLFPSHRETKQKMGNHMMDFFLIHSSDLAKVIFVDTMKSTKQGLPSFSEMLVHIDSDGELTKIWEDAFAELNASFWYKHIHDATIVDIVKLINAKGVTSIPENIVELMQMHPNAESEYLNSLRIAPPSSFYTETLTPVSNEKDYLDTLQGVRLRCVEDDVIWRCHFNKQGILHAMSNDTGIMYTRAPAGKFGDPEDMDCIVLYKKTEYAYDCLFMSVIDHSKKTLAAAIYEDVNPGRDLGWNGPFIHWHILPR